MNKTIDYQFNTQITADWQHMLTSTDQLERNPLQFLIAARQFFLSIHRYHQRIDCELGGDDIGNCVSQMATNRTCLLSEKSARCLKQIIDGCVNYSLYVHRNKMARHNKILNEETRSHLNSNELQTWYMTLARYLPLVTVNMEVMVRSERKLFDKIIFPDKKDYSYPSLLIDLSEDYFFETVLSMIHSLSQYVATQTTSNIEKQIIRELLNKAKELLYDRSGSLFEKYEELANLAVYCEHNSNALHDLINQFIESIPPGLTGYKTVPHGDKKKFIKRNLEKTRKLLSSKMNFISSQVVTFFLQQQFYEDPSIEGKLYYLPFYQTAKSEVMTVSEDYFLKATFQLINRLCLYVLQRPEANIFHDRHHLINRLLKKAGIFLLDRETSSITRLKELAIFAIKLDTAPKGSLHEIIQEFVSKEPALSEYSRKEISLEKRDFFIDYKLQLHASIYSLKEGPHSALSNQSIERLLIGMPHVILAHLEKNYQKDLKPFWKFFNWFFSIFDCCHPLKTEIRKNQIKQDELSSDESELVSLGTYK